MPRRSVAVPFPHAPAARRAVAAAWAAALLLAGCGAHKPPAAASGGPVPVTLASCVRRDLPRTIRVTGTLYANEACTVAAKVAGRIAALRVDLGDRVEPGAALADLDPVDYRLMVAQREAALAERLARIGARELPGDDADVAAVPEVARARAEADNAAAKLARAERLQGADPPVISPQDYADAQTMARAATANVAVAVEAARAAIAEARVAAADLDAARQRLADAQPSAPAAGAGRFAVARWAVAERLLSTGDYAKEGQALVRLVDDHLIKLRADVAERAAAALAVGQPVTVVLGDGSSASGAIGRLAPEIDPSKRALRIEAWFDNPDGRLRPGAFATATITTGIAPGVVLAPHAAVLAFAGSNTVFAVGAGAPGGERRARAVSVQVGEAHGDLVELTGYDGADPLAVDGVSKLADGTAVRVLDAAPLGQAAGAPAAAAEPAP